MSEPMDQAGAESTIDVEISGLSAASTNSDLSKQLFVEQFASLRSEIDHRLNLRQQLIALNVLVAGTFLTLGVLPGEFWVVLVFYPLLAMFIAASWESNDLRIGQINWYIQTVVEQRLGDLGPGWETFRRQAFRSVRQRRSAFAYGGPSLRGAPGLIAISTRGLFLATQFLAVVVATVRFGVDRLQHQSLDALIHEVRWPINSIDQASLLGFLIAISLNIGIVVYTGFLLRHSRVRTNGAVALVGEVEPPDDERK